MTRAALRFTLRSALLAASLLCASQPAQAAPEALSAERFTVGLPVEAQLLGAGIGLHPELLWRPFDAEGVTHVRLATGFTAGRGHAILPVTLGLREVIGPSWRVHPVLGAGLQLQGFLPYGAPLYPRLDLYLELGAELDLRDGWSIGAEVSPEIALTGVGFGAGVRLAVRKDLPW